MHTFLLNNPVLLDKIPDVPYCLDLIGQQQAKEGLPDCFILQDHPVHVVQLRHYMRQDKFSLKVTERSESGLKHVFGASPVLVGVQVSKEHIGSPDGFQHMNGSGTVGSFSQAAAGPGTCIWHSGGDALVPGEWLEFVVELHVDATAKPGTIAVVSVVVEASNEPAGIFAPGEFRKAGTIKEKLNAFSETVKQKLSDSVETLKLKPKLLFWHGRRMFVLLLWTLLLLVVMVSSGDPDPLDIIWGEQRLSTRLWRSAKAVVSATLGLLRFLLATVWKLMWAIMPTVFMYLFMQGKDAAVGGVAATGSMMANIFIGNWAAAGKDLVSVAGNAFTGWATTNPWTSFNAIYTSFLKHIETFGLRNMAVGLYNVQIDVVWLPVVL